MTVSRQIKSLGGGCLRLINSLCSPKLDSADFPHKWDGAAKMGSRSACGFGRFFGTCTICGIDLIAHSLASLRRAGADSRLQAVLWPFTK